MSATVYENFSPEPNTGCWIWLGSIYSQGYGMFKSHGRRYVAHRVMYEHFKGEIPAGLTLDHKCRNRWCVNPDHLEPMSLRENILRGISPSAKHARQTHCKRGHLLAEPNLIHSKTKPNKRRCLECSRMWNHIRRHDECHL